MLTSTCACWLRSSICIWNKLNNIENTLFDKIKKNVNKWRFLHWKYPFTFVHNNLVIITSLYPTIYHLPSYWRKKTVPSALIIFRSKDHFWPDLSTMYGSYNMKHRNVDLYAGHMFTKNNNRHKQWIAGFQARQTFLTIRHLYRHRAQNYFFYCFSKLLHVFQPPKNPLIIPITWNPE